jgi:hypothetical protein
MRERERVAKAEHVCGYAQQTTINSPTTSQKRKRKIYIYISSRPSYKRYKSQFNNYRIGQAKIYIFLQDPHTNDIKANLTIIGLDKPKKED